MAAEPGIIRVNRNIPFLSFPVIIELGGCFNTNAALGIAVAI
jgi:hypothetical protein